MLPTYLSFQKKEDYFQLLWLARQSGWNEAGLSAKEQHRTIQALTSHQVYKEVIRPILPLLYQNIRRRSLCEELSSESKLALEEKNISIIASEMIAKQWLYKTLELFQQNKIQVILLKSAAFAGTLYSTTAPRPGSDIDLLVTDANFENACNLLSEQMVPLLINQNRLATHNTLFERVFRPKQGVGPTIEIHRGLTNPHIFTISEHALWKQSTAHPDYDENWVRILSPEHSLLHLAVHAFRDLDFCTHNLIDAHEIISQWQPKTEILIDQARDWGAKNVLYCLLENCQSVLSTRIDKSLLAALKPHPMTDSLNIKILKSITWQGSIEKSKKFRLQQLLSQFSFPDKLSNSLYFQLKYLNTRIKDLSKL